MSNGKHYVVQYVLDYAHRVQVGIQASSRDAAVRKAQKALDAGNLWDDTEDMPLLLDDLEEKEGQVQDLEVVAEGDTWPAADATVLQLRVHATAVRACGLLVDAYRRGAEASGSIAWEDLHDAFEAASLAIMGNPGPSGAKSPMLIVDVEGGNVRHASADVPVELMVLNYDGVSAGAGLDLPQRDGTRVRGQAISRPVVIDPTYVREIFRLARP